MAATHTHTPRPYSAGQAVEVLAPDFTTPGFPRVWHAATVEAVTPLDGGLVDVTVRRADGIATVQRVGKRGGNRNLRAAR